ncbi:hypothetical protein [Streptomyces sp. NPDC050560]|uniref:hypothetical protein n=1 Tax=Streptomyces sp. NPDC050560 TaxID=3365630 RepID=UPI0037B8CE77
MKRGLVVLDEAEVPGAEWRGRMDTLRHDLAGAGVDVALVYGDVYASDDIAYLTNLCIYWNEGVLAVPVSGESVFLTKLSPRVHPWMRRISTVDRIESGRGFGALVSALLGGRAGATVGLVDADRWPAPVVAEVRAALPGLTVRELPSLVRDRRAVVSPAELALLRRGGAVVGSAVDAAAADGLGERERVATVERLVRGAGFLDVKCVTAGAPDGAATVAATGQFRTGWLHAARIADAGASPWAGALRAALDAAVAAVREGASARTLAEAAAPALAGLPRDADARVRWTNQADLASAGEYHRRPPGEALAAGAVVAVGVDVLFGAGGYAEAADTVRVTRDGAERLTGAAGDGGEGGA